MSVPSTSSCLSPSKSTRCTFDTAGVLGMSGIVKRCRVNRTGDSPGSGHGSGAGRRSGARLVIERQHLRHVGRQLHRPVDDCREGRCGGRRFSRMNIIRMNSSRHASRGRMSGGGNAWQVPQTARACCSSPLRLRRSAARPRLRSPTATPVDRDDLDRRRTHGDKRSAEAPAPTRDIEFDASTAGWGRGPGPGLGATMQPSQEVHMICNRRTFFMAASGLALGARWRRWPAPRARTIGSASA